MIQLALPTKSARGFVFRVRTQREETRFAQSVKKDPLGQVLTLKMKPRDVLNAIVVVSPTPKDRFLVNPVLLESIELMLELTRSRIALHVTQGNTPGLELPNVPHVYLEKRLETPIRRLLHVKDYVKPVNIETVEMHVSLVRKVLFHFHSTLYLKFSTYHFYIRHFRRRHRIRLLQIMSTRVFQW